MSQANLARESPGSDPEALLRQFEEAWLRGPTPALEPYLPRNNSAARRRALLELVKIDLEYRWRSGQRLSAPGDRWLLEDYARHFADLGPPSSWSDDLLAAEYRARRLGGDRPTVEDYARRLGHSVSRCQELLAGVDAELDEELPASIPPALPARPIPLPSVTAFLDVLREHRLLKPSQLNELLMEESAGSNVQVLARHLLERDWLTPYQVNLILQGRVHELLLGPYVVLRRLGEGASGQVFQVRHQSMNRVVALKLLRPAALASAGPDAVRRFYREIQAAGQLSHPNIVHAYDAGPIGNTHFLAMEYVEGPDLARLVKERGPLPVSEACAYARQVALGLQHGFERGLVHRDIKPGNILLALAKGHEPNAREDKSGSSFDLSPTPKVADFGLAGLRHTREARSSTSLTHEGDVMGTADYMAPEQAEDPHNVDIRADLYSLGCTVYYLLTGRPPFPGGTLFQKVDRHRWEDPPPVEQLRPDVSEAVAAVVRRLMAKQPEERYQTPAEASEALARATGGDAPTDPSAVTEVISITVPGDPRPATALLERITPAPPQWPRRHRRLVPLVILAVVGVVGLGALGAVLLSGPPTPPPSTGVAQVETKRAASGALSAYEKSVAGAGNPRQTPPGLVAVLGDSRLHHWSGVNAVAVRPDGQVVASGSEDGTVRLWDVPSGRQLQVLVGHMGPVLSVAIAPDGRTVASGSHDLKVIVWDVATGKLLRSLEGHRGGVTSLAFAPDGSLATGSNDTNIKLWDRTGKELRTISAGQGIVTSLAFNPDGSFLASSGDGGTVRLWERVSGNEVKTLEGHSGPVTAVVFHPTGKLLASGGRDSKVRLWTIPGGKEQNVLSLPGPVTALAYQPNGKLLASGGAEQKGCIWDTGTGKEVTARTTQPGMVTSVAFSGDGRVLASGGADNSVRLWDGNSWKPLLDRSPQPGPLYAVVFRPGSSDVAAGAADGSVRVWDSTTGTERRPLTGHSRPVTFLNFDERGRWLTGGGRDGAVLKWDMTTGGILRSIPGSSRDGPAVTLSADGRLLAAAAEGGVRLWDLVKRTPPVLLAHPAAVTAVALSVNGRQLASADAEGTIKLWDPATSKETRSFAAHQGDVMALTFSLDGALLASAGRDRTVRLWQTATGKELRTLHGHERQVLAVAFRPDGGLLASASVDGSVRLWDTSSGAQVQFLRLAPSGAAIHQVAFAPDGKELATANGNGTVYVLRLLD